MQDTTEVVMTMVSVMVSWSVAVSSVGVWNPSLVITSRACLKTYTHKTSVENR